MENEQSAADEASTTPTRAAAADAIDEWLEPPPPAAPPPRAAPPRAAAARPAPTAAAASRRRARPAAPPQPAAPAPAPAGRARAGVAARRHPAVAPGWRGAVARWRSGRRRVRRGCASAAPAAAPPPPPPAAAPVPPPPPPPPPPASSPTASTTTMPRSPGKSCSGARRRCSLRSNAPPPGWCASLRRANPLEPASNGARGRWEGARGGLLPRRRSAAELAAARVEPAAAEDESDELFAPSGLPMCASLWGDADADADGGGLSPSSALPRCSPPPPPPPPPTSAVPSRQWRRRRREGRRRAEAPAVPDHVRADAPPRGRARRPHLRAHRHRAVAYQEADLADDGGADGQRRASPESRAQVDDQEFRASRGG